MSLASTSKLNRIHAVIVCRAGIGTGRKQPLHLSEVAFEHRPLRERMLPSGRPTGASADTAADISTAAARKAAASLRVGAAYSFLECSVLYVVCANIAGVALPHRTVIAQTYEWHP